MSLPRCAEHERALATFRCDGCERLLCEDCVEDGAHLLFCRHCGEQALPRQARDPRDDPPADAAPAAPPSGLGRAPTPDPAGAIAGPETVYRPAAHEVVEEPPGLATLFVHHVVVPLAMIAMVVAMLFYLLDVASVFAGPTTSLKWLGFWFVVATVLVVRYARAYGRSQRAGCYTSALAAATFVATIAHQLRQPAAGLIGALVQGTILVLVWLFATRMTRELSIDDERRKLPSPRLYGLERLRFAAWQEARGHAEVPEDKPALPDPGLAVARLAASVLVLLAVCEPILLAAVPTVGERALGAMIVFLLATGVVLAAAATVRALRQSRRLGGRAWPWVVVQRVGVAAVLLVSILAMALLAPGIRFRGDGRLQPRQIAGGERLAEAAADATDDSPPQASPSSDAPTAADDSQEPLSDPASIAATAVVGWMAGLGRLLWIPMILLAILCAPYILWKLKPTWRHGGEWLANSLRRWLATLAARWSTRQRPTKQISFEPWTDVAAIAALPPAKAVTEAYSRWLLLSAELGFPRAARQTPYELAQMLPAPLTRLRQPVRTLTELYVKCAYSDQSVSPADRDQAMMALAKLRDLASSSQTHRPLSQTS